MYVLSRVFLSLSANFSSSNEHNPDRSLSTGSSKYGLDSTQKFLGTVTTCWIHGLSRIMTGRVHGDRSAQSGRRPTHEHTSSFLSDKVWDVPKACPYKLLSNITPKSRFYLGKNITCKKVGFVRPWVNSCGAGLDSRPVIRTPSTL